MLYVICYVRKLLYRILGQLPRINTKHYFQQLYNITYIIFSATPIETEVKLYFYLKSTDLKSQFKLYVDYFNTGRACV